MRCQAISPSVAIEYTFLELARTRGQNAPISIFVSLHEIGEKHHENVKKIEDYLPPHLPHL